MKIINGNFGATGAARFEDGMFYIGGMKYQRESMHSMNFDTKTEKELSALSVVLGIFIMIMLGALFGILGFLGGLLLTIAGSHKKTTTYLVEIILDDGKQATVSCSRREYDRLMAA